MDGISFILNYNELVIKQFINLFLFFKKSIKFFIYLYSFDKNLIKFIN